MAVTPLILLWDPITWHDLDVLYLPDQLSGDNPQIFSCTLTGYKRFLRNMCLVLSGEHLKLHLSYLCNGNWNYQMTTTCLLLLLWTWLTLSPTRYILVLYLNAKDFLRNMSFALINGYFEITLFLSLQWKLKFLNDYNLFNIALELGRHYPPTGTFFYSPWMQKNFQEICLLHWVMDIWNCTFPLSTIEIEISNGCNSLNIALGSHNLTWFGCFIPSWPTQWSQPPGTFFYSTWLQKHFWEICVLHWVMVIWNWTFPICTVRIEIFKWL